MSSSGKITAVKAGTATIVAKSEQGGIKAKCVVTVENPAIKINLSTTSASLTPGDQITLTATVLPSNTTDKSVTWSSSDKSVASVDSNGLVTAVSAGSAVITATASNGITRNCKIIVVDEDENL